MTASFEDNFEPAHKETMDISIDEFKSHVKQESGKIKTSISYM